MTDFDSQPERLSRGKCIPDVRAVTVNSEGIPLHYRLFKVRHRTNYHYQQAVERSVHVFRLFPVDDCLQEVVSSKLCVSEDGEAIRYEDVFGNLSLHYGINRTYNDLSIDTESIVRLYANPEEDDNKLSRRESSIPLIWMPWQRQMMMAYLLPSELPEGQLHELTDYAMSFVERNDYHLIRTMEDINQTIFREYDYVQGITSIYSTAFDCYQHRRGVCQDFTNLFICLARLLGVPARYRMGYIFTGDGFDNTLQSQASHAWAELFLPYVGWRGYDPTNGCITRQDHIRVACGRNFRDATPTSGTIYGDGGGETLDVFVTMEEIVAKD